MFSEVGISQADDCIKIFAEDSVFALHITKLLIRDPKLRGALAIVAAANAEVIDVEVASETATAKRNVGALLRSLSAATQLIVVGEVHVLRVDLLVQDPGVAAARVEKSSDLLRRLVTHVDICHIRVVNVVVQVQAKTSGALLVDVV